MNLSIDKKNEELAKKINFKLLFSLIGVIFTFEILSFLSYRTPLLNNIFFILICLGAAVATYKKLEWGLLIILTELFIASQGYLFYLTYHGSRLSIRIALFFIILAVWFFKHTPWKRIKEYRRDKLVKLFLVFIGVMIYGTILGKVMGNGLKDILADGQRYVYFGLLFVFLDVYAVNHPSRGAEGGVRVLQTEHEHPPTPLEGGFGRVARLLHLLYATIITLTTKATLILLLTMNNVGNESSTRLIYNWVRPSSRVGEITDMKNGFFRVFIQSQIFELMAIFILTLFIAYLLNMPRTKDAMNRISTGIKKYIIFYSSLLFVSCFAIVLGLSRSFWAAGFGTGIFLVGFMIFRFRLKWKAILASLAILAIAGFASVGIVNYALGAKVNNRVNASDPAASSRWKMLPPLVSAIKVHPIIGSGLGKTITYQSDDPRFKNEKNPEGWLTTYALEWGYLDFILKFGIIGTGLYLWFLGYVAWEGWKLTNPPSRGAEGGVPSSYAELKHPPTHLEGGFESAIIAGGFLLGLIAVYATHMLSPYLNHPLGIGYVLVCVGVFRALKNSKNEVKV